MEKIIKKILTPLEKCEYTAKKLSLENKALKLELNKCRYTATKLGKEIKVIKKKFNFSE